MVYDQKFPKVWQLLERFRENCNSKGWKTSDDENLVKIENKYHNLIETYSTHLSTFKRIAASKRRAVREGQSYRPVNVSYIAWVFQKPPPQQLVETLMKNSELSKSNALYDLSSIYQGKTVCVGVNLTDSPVFRLFEEFLKETFGVETKYLYRPTPTEPKTFKSKLQKASIG